MGAAEGECGREEARHGRVRGLPQGDEAADVGEGEKHQDADRRQAAEEEGAHGEPVPQARPSPADGAAATIARTDVGLDVLDVPPAPGQRASHLDPYHGRDAAFSTVLR